MSLLWVYLSLFSAVLFAFKDILVKDFLISKKSDSKEIIFHEYSILFLFISILSLVSTFTNFSGIFLDLDSFFVYHWLYILKALVIATATFIYFNLLDKYEISEVSPLINLSPLFLIILSAIFLSEIITIVQFLGIIIMILATYFLEVIVHHHNSISPHKHHFLDLFKKDFSFFLQVFLLLLVFSLAAIFDKFILSNVNVYTNMFFTSFFVLIGLFIYYLKIGQLKKSFKIFNVSHKIWIITFFTILSNFLILFAIAIPGAFVSLIIPLRRTSTLFSSFFGGILFHEKHLGKKLIVICFMLFGVILIVI